MKTFTVGEAQGQLAELIAQAHKGAVIVLTDGKRQVWLDTNKPLDLETDNSELEAELVKAIEGPFTLYSPQEMRSFGERIIKNLKPLSKAESRRCYQQPNREFDALEHHLASLPLGVAI